MRAQRHEVRVRRRQDLAAGQRPAAARNREVSTAHTARSLADACVAYAAQKKYTTLGISVVDPDGNLLSFPGRKAQATALKTAELNATTAAHWRRPTIELWERLNR